MYIPINGRRTIGHLHIWTASLGSQIFNTSAEHETSNDEMIRNWQTLQADLKTLQKAAVNIKAKFKTDNRSNCWHCLFSNGNYAHKQEKSKPG